MDGRFGLTEGLDDELENAAALFSAGFDDGQHRFDEAAATFALSAETQLAPDHSVTQAAFARIVGRLDFLANWLQVAAKSRVLDRSAAASGVLDEQLLRFSHQIVTKAFELVVTRIDQCLPMLVGNRGTPQRASPTNFFPL